jgi:MbtH protein
LEFCWAKTADEILETIAGQRINDSKHQRTQDIRGSGMVDPVYRVVINIEEQYSIWPADRDLPAGWSDAGRTGTRTDCLSHIEHVWTDMRPLSARKRQDAAGGSVD